MGFGSSQSLLLVRNWLLLVSLSTGAHSGLADLLVMGGRSDLIVTGLLLGSCTVVVWHVYLLLVLLSRVLMKLDGGGLIQEVGGSIGRRHSIDNFWIWAQGLVRDNVVSTHVGPNLRPLKFLRGTHLLLLCTEMILAGITFRGRWLFVSLWIGNGSLRNSCHYVCIAEMLLLGIKFILSALFSLRYGLVMHLLTLCGDKAG